LDFFIKHKIVGAVKSTEGSYDLMIAIYVKSYPVVHSFWQNTLKKYGKYFSKKVFTAFSQEEYYSYRFLLDEKDIKPIILHQWFDSGKRIEINDIDYKLLRLITENSRLSTLDMAKELSTTSSIINYHLKKLRESEIILAYRINLNFPKLGYFPFKVDIELNKFDEIDKILNYIKSNQNFMYLCKTIGYVDLEIGFLLNNSYQLNQIMESLSNRFPNAIKNYSYFSVIKTFKDYFIKI